MLAQIRIVLVETSHPGNIGAVARAMKNMQLEHLYLVNPAEFPSEEAERRSSGANDILRQARVVEELRDAIGDCSWVIGASARSRHLTWPVTNPREMCREIQQHIDNHKNAGPQEDGRVAILFGREDSGLSNEELQHCQRHVHIPSNPAYSSLNIAMAVQIICYELYLTAITGGSIDHSTPVLAPGDPGWDEQPATHNELEKFFQHLEKTLIDVGFHDPKRPRQLMPRLRRLFQRTPLDRMEVNILRGFLKSVQKTVGTWDPQKENSPRK